MLNCFTAWRTDLYPVEIVIERVDDYEDITELGRDDSPPVVPPVLSPYDVNLIIPWENVDSQNKRKY